MRPFWRIYKLGSFGFPATNSFIDRFVAVALADDVQHKFSEGENVIRKDNVCVVLSPRGDSLRATVNQSYIDVSVHIGR